MVWNNWSFHKVARYRNVGIMGYPAKVHNDNSLTLLLADDEWGGTEERARQFCETFLALPSGAAPVNDDVHVEVYFVINFELEKDILADPDKYDFDGILQDLRDERDDDNLPGELNLQQLRQLGESPRTGVLIISQHSDVKVFERAKAGLAHRFALRKKDDPSDRNSYDEKVLRDFFRYVELRRFMRTSPMREELKRFVGVSTLYRIVDFLKHLENDKENNRLPIVILGPTGCGKEHVARLIHDMDCISRPPPPGPPVEDKKKKFNNFVPVLIGAIAEGVMEGELFGVHNLGGMERPIRGYLRDAENGTAFFDELGDIPLNIQGKLLRFLQEGEVHPIGGELEKVNDVRSVFATHKDMLKDGILREDFLHRIDGLTIRLPSLAERLDEHQLLIDHFFIKNNIKQEAVEPNLNEHLLKLCREGAFTGNVRQLATFIKRLVRFATRNNPIGMYEYQLAVDHSLMPPGFSLQQGKPKTDATIHPLETIFGDMAWNAFIQSDRWVKGKCMKAADEKGIKPKEVVEFLMGRETSEVFYNASGAAIDAPDRDELQKRLTSLYQRNKENWIATFDQRQKG